MPGNRKRKTQHYIEKVKSIRWGERHGVLLDFKGRVFTMGDSEKGKLGLIGELPPLVERPR
jgi:alpha-tubulin suppressor-like RCC1 family protein